MQITDSAGKISEICQAIKKTGKTIGLVPTMGYLHQGHLSLIEISKKNTDFTVATVFVNPTQFNDPKDLELYPRDLERDMQLLTKSGVDILFAPSKEEIYCYGFDTFINVAGLSAVHEGEFRPGHFQGVTTVVNILFNLIQPDQAFFGEKDFQQLAIIKKMVSDLKIPVNVAGCPIVRESDGLALSSRNVRLSQAAREIAPKIYQTLEQLQSAFSFDNCNSDKLISLALLNLKDPAFRVEYLRIVDSGTLEIKKKVCRGDRALIAAFLDGVRLIDNVEI